MKNNALNILEEQRNEVDSYLNNIRLQLSWSKKNASADIKKAYSMTLATIENMLDLFFDMRAGCSGLETRLKSKIRKQEEASAKVIKKLELLLELEYTGTSFMDDEAKAFREKVNKINSAFKSEDTNAVVSDIQTLHDVSEFILKRAKSAHKETPSDNDEDNNPDKPIVSLTNKLSLKRLFHLPRDSIYRMFAGEKIFKFIQKVETSDSSFNYAARAYQHTNEPMVRLYKDLKLDLSGHDVLAITCSGDPVGFFAALGAKRLICFDTSYKATLYAEFKVECIKALSFKEYNAFFGIDGEMKEEVTNIYRSKIRPNLSDAARNSFDVLFKNKGRSYTLIDLLHDEHFFRSWGFACPHPESNLFSKSSKHYAQAQEMMSTNAPVFIPAGINEISAVVDIKHKFGACYLSNAPDHFRDASGNVNPTKKVLHPFYANVDSLLHGRGSKMIFNFQWGDRAVDSSRQALDELGYDLKLTEPGAGCGRMAVAEKIK